MPKVESTPAAASWENLIDGLRDNWGNSRNAIHRPLLTLILLARAQQGEVNWVRFNDIDDLFRDVLREFPPSSNPSGLEYPFWYLQKNGFWIIEHSENLPRVKTKDRPTRPALVKHNPKGYVPVALWNELLNTPGLIEKLAARVLDVFWPDLPRTCIARVLGLVVEERNHDQP
jgi:predicted restriction endonuclease